MEVGYDVLGAAKKLEELALDRYNSSNSGVQLARVASVTAHYEATPAGRSWILVNRQENEELVVSFQGIIAKKDLPPFTEKLGRTSNHVKYLRQSVSIAGLETFTFRKVVNAIADVHAVLGRTVGMHNIQDCGMIGLLHDMRVIELSNRYFKHRQSESGLTVDEVKLSPAIDPHGYLASAASSLGLYHSEENVVQYFERDGINGNDYRYRDAKPVIFGVGDIVEIQASFVAYPLKNGKYKSAMTLRSITLLDGTFTQARVRDLIIHKSSLQKHNAPVKRKVGYGEEVMTSARAKLAKMDLDEQSDDGTNVLENGVVLQPEDGSKVFTHSEEAQLD